MAGPPQARDDAPSGAAAPERDRASPGGHASAGPYPYIRAAGQTNPRLAMLGLLRGQRPASRPSSWRCRCRGGRPICRPCRRRKAAWLRPFRPNPVRPRRAAPKALAAHCWRARAGCPARRASRQRKGRRSAAPPSGTSQVRCSAGRDRARGRATATVPQASEMDTSSRAFASRGARSRAGSSNRGARRIFPGFSSQPGSSCALS